MGGIPRLAAETLLAVGVIFGTILTSVIVALVVYGRVCNTMRKAKHQRRKLQSEVEKLRNRSPELSRWRVYTSYSGINDSYTAVKPIGDCRGEFKIPMIPEKFESASDGTTCFRHKDEDDSRCCICSHDWQVDDIVSLDQACGHVSHHECLSAWFKKATIPTCVRCQTKFEWQHTLVAKE